MEELTHRQQAILEFVATRIAAYGLPPTLAEIAQAFEFNQARAAQKHLTALATKGYLELLPGKARGIRILRTPINFNYGTAINSEDDSGAPGTPIKSASQFGDTHQLATADDKSRTPTKVRAATLILPIRGRVAAGSPIGAASEAEAPQLVLDRALFSRTPHYLLRVQGDSMQDEGILDGDLIAVHQTPVAEHGEIVVARLEDEVTVKRLHREGRRVLLLPRNADYAPIEVPATAHFAIEGLYCGLVRRA
jgi:repressor LexA